MPDNSVIYPLTRRQKVFIEEYLTCWNASEAARRAGYKGRSDTVGPRLLNYPGVNNAIDNRLSELKVNKSNIGKKRINGKSNWVYLFQEDFAGLIKIGIAKNPLQRMAALQTSCPQTITMLAQVNDDDAKIREAELHVRYAKKHVRREWFRLTENDIEAIRLEWENSR